jgi:hypothetical protein
MSHAVWYDTPFTCLHCRSEIPAADTPVHSSGLGPLPGDLRLAPGHMLEIERGDFDIAFEPLGQAPASATVRALEQWACPVCGSAQYALLEFEPQPPDGYRLVSAQAVAATPQIVHQVHGVSPRVLAALQLQSGEHDVDVLAALRTAPAG